MSFSWTQWLSGFIRLASRKFVSTMVFTCITRRRCLFLPVECFNKCVSVERLEKTTCSYLVHVLKSGSHVISKKLVAIYDNRSHYSAALICFIIFLHYKTNIVQLFQCAVQHLLFFISSVCVNKRTKLYCALCYGSE